VLSALAARLRDMELAEDAFGHACAAAAASWGAAPPRDPAAWLYAVALRRAWDVVRHARVAGRAPADAAAPVATPEEIAMAAAEPITDERLRLVFTCCHPALDPAARVALTLRVVCGLSPAAIAHAYLVPEPTLAQRLTRARRKIRDAGIGYEVPARPFWAARLASVLATIEIAYAEAHGDAALSGVGAVGLEMVALSGALAEMLPDDAEVLALAALTRFAEARRPARLDARGAMVPLDAQDPGRWDRALIAAGEALLRRAAKVPGPVGPYQLLAAIHAAHAGRRPGEPPPWGAIAALYDVLLGVRPGPVVAVNRAVAIAGAKGAAAGLAALEAISGARGIEGWLPWHAARAELLARAGDGAAARDAYRAALALGPPPAERLFLEDRLEALASKSL